MSKKNSNVNLKNKFENFKDLSKIYLNFKKKITLLKRKSFLVAVSGGPDSLALAALIKTYSYEKKIKPHYVLIDHNIRKNSSKEARQVKSLLKKKQINLHILINKMAIKKNIQSNARNIRYELLGNYCKINKLRVVLTAHNLEDQVETFFIRLSRGSGLTGLSSMKPLSDLKNNIKLCRPLLDTKKKDLIKISKLTFGKYFNDPSNKDKKYLRTKIRDLKKPLSKSGIDYEQIIKSINNLASSKETLDEYFNKIFRDTVKKQKNKISINLKKFHNFNEEIRMMLINKSIKVLKKNYYNPRSKKVINLIKEIENYKYLKSTLGGCIISKKSNILYLTKEKSNIY